VVRKRTRSPRESYGDRQPMRPNPVSPSVTWDQRLNELEQFKKQHGHCNVPQKYPPNPSLAHWVTSIRMRKKRGALAKKRVRALNKLGFRWVLKERSVHRYDWDKMLAALAAFKRRHGHCGVPYGWRENPQLAPWLTGMRQRKRDGRLDRRKIEQLDRLDMLWEPKEAQWQRRYLALVKYRKEHGDCNVPYAWPDNLGKWVGQQRSLRKHNMLQQSRIERLDKLGFAWDCCESWWDTMYSALAEYQKEYGHCRVSTLSKTHTRLGRWVQTQRARKREGKLSEERIRRLDLLGFTWDCGTSAGITRKP
jgi:hypothetical protein